MDIFSRLLAGVTVTISLESVIAIGVLIIGFIAWLSRLESKVYWLEKDHDKNLALATIKDSERKAEHEKKEEAVWKKFEAVQDGITQRFETSQKTMNQILMSLGELKGSIGRQGD